MMHAAVLALVLSAQPGSADDVVARAFVAAPASHSPDAPAAPAARLWGWGLALCAVAALVATALKRRSQKPEAGFAEVAQHLAVGAKRSLLVVNFAGKRLLVGSTEAGFTVLSSEPKTSLSEFEALLAPQRLEPEPPSAEEALK